MADVSFGCKYFSGIMNYKIFFENFLRSQQLSQKALSRGLTLEEKEELAKVMGLQEDTYLIYIKSHSEAPDYENQVEAKNLWEAAGKFWEQLGEARAEWTPEDLLPHIAKSP